jgi:tetratricopeptide (TPR) repeat protein
MARTLVVIVVVASLAGGAIALRAAHFARSACEREVQSGNVQRAMAICNDNYERTHSLQDLDRAAHAAMQIGDLARLERLASALLRGPYVGDAHYFLAYVYVNSDRSSAAWPHAEIAFAVHLLAGDDRRLVGDATLLSDIALRQGEYTAAIAYADDAIRRARALQEPSRATRPTIARADALRRVGDVAGAITTLEHFDHAAAPCDKAWFALKLAMAREEADQRDRAIADLASAERYNLTCNRSSITDAISSNRVWLLRETEPAEASRLLASLMQPDASEEPELRLLHGYLAADRGELETARSDFDLAAQLPPPDADWPWVILRAQAELAELRGSDVALAELHYRRATAKIAALRSTARARLAYLVASHRGPYDGLIALLARQGRWREVLDVVLELDASDMLRATANEIIERDRPAISLPEVNAAPPRRPTVDAVLAAWRSRDLAIVIAPSRRQIAPGGERGYRLRITDGQVTGEDIGPASEAQQLADRLFHDPGDRGAARTLGAMMIPPGAEHTTLHVLAIGALGRVPLAALRDADDALILARRPLVRVLGLAATGPESRGSGPPVVIADPSGGLASAATEGAMVAKALGAGTRIAGAGTPVLADRALLWSARDAGLLHVAGHVDTSGRWRALHLADGPVEPAEMLNHGLAPRLAVLAGCGSAAARDAEGWGSIASALLTAGTAVVIATDRTVLDASALAVMRAFYADPDWRSEPERALARVQQAFAAGTPADRDDPAQPQSWAAFSVLRRPPVIAATD